MAETESPTNVIDMTDRISELPDHLKHKILSGLPSSKEAALTSVLSRSWKDVWITLPCLNLQFITLFIQASPSCTSKRWFEAINRVLTKRSRCGGMSLQRLTLDIPGLLFEKNLEQTCLLNELVIHACAEFHVEELELHVTGDNIGTGYAFPISSFAPTKKSINTSHLHLEKCALHSCLETTWCALKSLSLVGVALHQRVLDSLTANLPTLESLSLVVCVGSFDTLNALNCKRLVHVKVQSIFLSRIEINAPNLLSFLYANGSLFNRFCVIRDLTLSKNLRSLVIQDIEADFDELLEGKISQFDQLEELVLEGFDKIKHVRISNRSLRSVEISCNNNELIQLQIDTPKLLKLVLLSTPIEWFMLNAPLLSRVNLKLIDGGLDQRIPVQVQYEKLVTFLSNFHGVQELEIFTRDPSRQGHVMRIPLEFRKQLSPPLTDVKHLIIKYNAVYIHGCEDFNFKSLFESLFWLSLNPAIISINLIKETRLLNNRWEKEEVMDEKMLKFEYEEKDCTSLEKCDICGSLPAYCWRHNLKKVTIIHKGSNAMDQVRAETDSLLIELLKKASKPREIVVDVESD